MKILEKILFAQDFTSSAKNLKTVAISIAKTFDSTVIPIHVLPDDIVNAKVKQLLDETAASKLASLSKDFENEKVNLNEPLVEYGVPYQVIVNTAAAINANLILLGSGENKTEEKFKLGTTTERIIQNSEKPVMVIKEDDTFNVKTILCPVDFSDPSKRALKNAIIFARRFKAHLVILSVSEAASTSWFGSKEDLEKENAERLEKHTEDFNAFLTEFNLKGLSWSQVEKSGNPAEEILNTIAQKNIDLLVIGTAGRTGLNRLIMGSVTEKVIREVPCSFLTLKSEDVISLKLETNLNDFETSLATAEQLEKDGLFEEAIEYYKNCLTINTMHVPAYTAIAELYDKLNDPNHAALYRKSAKDIKDRLWYTKIEEEVRKLRGS